MLHIETLPPNTLELLKELSAFKSLTKFGLVGGTNLALRYAHRISVELNFFSNQPFEQNSLVRLIENNFRHYELLFQKHHALVFDIENTRVDFVLYPFPWLNTFDTIDSLRLASVEDIIPMKLQGMENRKSKKDFWDIACLLDHYPLHKIMEIMRCKFPFVDIGQLIHALTYFDDADLQPDPIALNNWGWEFVKNKVQTEAIKFANTFLKK